MKGVGVARLVKILLAGYAVSLCLACGPPLTSEEILADGPYVPETMSTTFYDAERGRTLQAIISYPAEDVGGGTEIVRAAHPLIVYSHGFSSFMGEGAYLTRHLATHGYVVVEPQYPFTNLNAPGGPDLSDVVNQPGDVSFIIDTMLAWNEAPGNLFESSIDPDRIGATGLSLGGLTTLLVTYHAELRDPRIKAAAPIAAPSDLFGPGFYETANVPLMMLLSELDALIDYEASGPVAKASVGPPSYIVTFFMASHTGWSNFAAQFFDDVNNADTIGCGAIAGELPSDPDELEEGGFDLGGPELGILESTARPACSYGAELITAMRPSRQHELTILAIRPFFDAFLREDSKAGLVDFIKSFQFLCETLEAENANEIDVFL